MVQNGYKSPFFAMISPEKKYYNPKSIDSLLVISYLKDISKFSFKEVLQVFLA